MGELRLRRRHRLKKKEIKRLSEDISDILGVDIFNTDDTVDMANASDYEVILVSQKIIGFVIDEKPFLSVKGLLGSRPEKKWVEVDMGAVPFVTNGADIMAPGITDADREIMEDDIIWIRDQKNKQPLAVGRALLSGEEMVRSDKGKAVKSLHYVGDELWNYNSG